MRENCLLFEANYLHLCLRDVHDHSKITKACKVWGLFSIYLLYLCKTVLFKCPSCLYLYIYINVICYLFMSYIYIYILLLTCSCFVLLCSVADPDSECH